MISYPALCITDASRQVFCLALYEKLRLWQNIQCSSVTTKEAKAWQKVSYSPKEKEVLNAKNIYQESVKETAYWKPVIANAIKSGAIVYPNGMNLTNEGSKLAFLYELHQKLREGGRDMLQDDDVKLVNSKIGAVKKEARATTKWEPDLGDVS